MSSEPTAHAAGAPPRSADHARRALGAWPVCLLALLALVALLALLSCGGGGETRLPDGPFDISDLTAGVDDGGAALPPPCVGHTDCDDRNPCNGVEQCEDGRCTDPPDLPASPCALMDGSRGVCGSGECAVPRCGDGVQDEDEQCDDRGESARCNEDCTSSRCGDRVVNAAAGEQCDDGEPSPSCNDDCTLSACGDGVVNEAAGEACEGGGMDCDRDCTVPECGDGVWNEDFGEQCDDGEASSSCNGDCTVSVCGDGVVNDAAGEECDDEGESERCNADCTESECGDGKVDEEADEECDDEGESDTCDADCTLPACGDAVLNTDAGEECDDGGESEDCNADCTESSCGDQKRNASAGEACDEGDETALCDADCTLPTCGDEEVNEAAGEVCDVTVATSECDLDCTEPECGDGVTNLEVAEECDPPSNLSGGGCDWDCTFSCYDDGDCVAPSRCEDHACLSPRWRAPERLSAPGDEPQDVYLAWDGNGALVIAWSNDDGLDTQVMTAVAIGDVIGPPTPLDPDATGDASVTSIFTDRAGNVSIGISGEPGSGGEARVARYHQDTGMSLPVTVESAAGFIYPVAAFSHQDGAVFTAWIEQTLLAPPDETYDVRGALDTGSGFGPAAALESEAPPLSGLLAFDARLEGMLAFQHASTGIYVVRTQSDFLPAQLVAPVGADSTLNGDHRVAIDAYGGALLVWSEYASISGKSMGRVAVYDEEDDAWSAPAPLGPADANIYEPQLALTAYGNGHVAYVESSGALNRIQIAQCYTSIGCVEPVSIFASSGLDIERLTLGDDKSGNAHLVWVQSDDSSSELVARRYPATFGGPMPRIERIATVTEIDSFSGLAVDGYYGLGAVAFVDEGVLYVARYR